MSLFRRFSRLPLWKTRKVNSLNYFKFQNFSQSIPDIDDLEIEENLKNEKKRVLDDGKKAVNHIKIRIKRA